MSQSSGSKKLPVNEAIVASKVRLVDETGKQVGVVSLPDALDAARGASLDLVLIAESSNPPVAKIMDYGRHIFNKKKNKSAAKRKQKQIQIKEIKFRPSTDVGDYNIKLRNLVRFLEAGDKVKVTLRYRGREMAHQELGMEMMQRVEGDLSLYGTMEMAPKMEGRQLSMVFSPHKKGSAEAAKREKILLEAAAQETIKETKPEPVAVETKAEVEVKSEVEVEVEVEAKVEPEAAPPAKPKAKTAAKAKPTAKKTTKTKVAAKKKPAAKTSKSAATKAKKTKTDKDK